MKDMWAIQVACTFLLRTKKLYLQYMDNLNVLGTLEELRTLEELTRIVNYFKKRTWNERFLENKIMSQPTIEHFSSGKLANQSICMDKVLKHFHMDKSHLLSTSKW